MGKKINDISSLCILEIFIWPKFNFYYTSSSFLKDGQSISNEALSNATFPPFQTIASKVQRIRTLPPDYKRRILTPEMERSTYLYVYMAYWLSYESENKILFMDKGYRGKKKQANKTCIEKFHVERTKI